MAGDPTKMYDRFAPPERLTLLIEAMARDDGHEVERLQRSCPRATCTAQDPEFEDRSSMAFDTLAVVTIDLRCMWGKLHVLRWVLGSIREMATAHRITAALGFIDGERCGKGLKQCEFFAKPLPQHDDGEELHTDPPPDEGDDDDDEGDEEVLEPTPEQVDSGRRMDAVERRVEHFTTCGAVVVLGAMDDIARDLVNTWEAWGRFCRTRLGVEPETMLRAWQFPLDEFLETLKRYSKVKPDPAKVNEYIGYICKHWDRRFRRRSGSEYATYADAEEEDGGDGDGD